MKLWSDAELVRQLQEHNPAAAEQLVEQYADKLYNYAYYHSGDHHLAEDIVSETYVRVIEKIGDFVVREVPFKAWIFRIAHNLLVDHFRKRKTRPSLSLDRMVQTYPGGNDIPEDWGAADGGDITDQIVTRLELHQLITTLPDDQRTVFILRFIEGLDLEQVALALDKSLPSIKSLQFRAVRNLRQAIELQDQQAAKPARKTKGALFR